MQTAGYWMRSRDWSSDLFSSDLRSGQPEVSPPGRRSACDALRSAAPGALTFPVNRKLLAGALAVSDETAFRAMESAFTILRIVAEPSGAVALGAVLSGDRKSTRLNSSH